MTDSPSLTNHGKIVERDPVLAGGKPYIMGTHMPYKDNFCRDCGIALHV